MSLAWQSAWQAVAHHPLFGVGLTLAAYQLASSLYERSRLMFLQPVLVSMALVIAVLVPLGIGYDEYRQSTTLLNLLLGPATVALAVPLSERA